MSIISYKAKETHRVKYRPICMILAWLGLTRLGLAGVIKTRPARRKSLLLYGDGSSKYNITRYRFDADEMFSAFGLC